MRFIFNVSSSQSCFHEITIKDEQGNCNPLGNGGKLNEAAKVLPTCLSNGIPHKICCENFTHITNGLYNGLVYPYRNNIKKNKVSKEAVRMAHFFFSLCVKDIYSGLAWASAPSLVPTNTCK